MKLEASEVARLFIVLGVALVAAHAMGALFTKLRQPPVIGEIVAGLILGPTLLGLVAAPVAAAFLASGGIVPTVLGVLSELGLLLLMFITGGELLIRPAAGENRTVAIIATTGMVVPFVCGLAVVPLLDHGDFSGASGNVVTFALVFGIAIAVTSIPVISRIMLDLGLLRTAFARVVLSVAALEDVILYVILAVALSVAHAPADDRYGLWAMTGVESTAWSMAYHIVITLALFAGFLLWGARLLRVLASGPLGFLDRQNSVAFRLVVLLGSVLLCLFLGVNPIFGALLAGIAVRRGALGGPELGDASPQQLSPTPGSPPHGSPTPGSPPPGSAPPAEVPAHSASTTGGAAHLRHRPVDATAAGLAADRTGRVGVVDGGAGTDEARRTGQPEVTDPAWETIRRFSLAFFIPIYFVVVGLKLDLIRNFDPLFFLWFLVLACVVKAVSVWAGARLAGCPQGQSIDLAVALNARGGPGIVLATVTLDAAVINEGFFTSIVLLSMLTSQLAGVWLDRRTAAVRQFR